MLILAQTKRKHPPAQNHDQAGGKQSQTSHWQALSHRNQLVLFLDV
jgi:hypothetical protein